MSDAEAPQKAEPLPDVGLMDALMEVEEERSELDKIFEQLLDNKNILHNTELNQNEVTAFSVLGPLSRRYNLEVLKDTLVENLIARVSRGRGGRKEIVKIVGKQLERVEEAEGRFQGLMNRRRKE